MVTLHTGPGMGLLGARVQLAGIEPPGTSHSQSERKIAPKVQLRSEREKERCQSEKPDPIGLAAAAIPRGCCSWKEEVSN